MKVLLDTNIIARAAQTHLTEWDSIFRALAILVSQRFELCVVPQNLYEFWVVATRPISSNGFGMSPGETKANIEECLNKFTLLRDERGIYDTWMQLVASHSVVGKTAHDARLVAAMYRHSLKNLLTINKSDFARYSISAFSPQDIIDGSFLVR